MPAGVNFASDNSYPSGPSFFERLFGGRSDRDAAGPGRPPAPAQRFHQVIPSILPGWGRISNNINDLAIQASLFMLTIIHPGIGIGHFFATVHGLG